jgi:energy-coupling factor transporter transmembrane protein EcfT
MLNMVRVCGEAERKSRMDAIDPRCRIICAFCTALAVASLKGAPALAAGSMLPLFLLFLDGRGGVPSLAKKLSSANKAGLLVALFLPITYPGDRVLLFFSAEGVKTALFVIWKLNIVSVVILKMVASMGVARINDALGGLRFPVKLRALLLLTMRFVFLLAERMAAMDRAAGLRSRNARGLGAYKTYACMVGTTLVHSADRAERSSFAMDCRGGISGFGRSPLHKWGWGDFALCSLVLLNSAWLAALSAASAILPKGF